ncbi:hypothetical protein Hanom_Chr03g00196491 [Helianthus anomalus]
MDQTLYSSSQPPITENILQQVTKSDSSIFANPSTVEEATPLELHVTLDGSSSGATTTAVESSYLHMDSSYISRTPLKATTANAIKVATSVFQLPIGVLNKISNAEGSPSTKKKGRKWMNH